MPINNTEASKIIINEGLALQKDVWHFTFNEEFNYRKYYYDKKKKVVISPPINQWAPLLVYCQNDAALINEQNFVTNNVFDKENKNYRKIFWYLKITDFDSFLQRRSDLSQQPQKNFPTLQTYYKKINSLGDLRLSVTDFEMDFYVEYFNKLKNDKHLPADEVLKLSIKNVKGLPMSWVKIACLYHENEIKVIMLLVDDKRSLCYVNMATEKSKHGYGLLLCTELVKYCAEHQYESFDSGVSGIYGNFKEKIYLDSREIFKIKKNDNLKYVKYFRNIFFKLSNRQ